MCVVGVEEPGQPEGGLPIRYGTGGIAPLAKTKSHLTALWAEFLLV